MLHLKLKSPLTKEEIKKRLEIQTNVRSYRQWQIIYAVANNEGKKSQDIATVLGIIEKLIERSKFATILSKLHYNFYTHISAHIVYAKTVV